MSNYFRLRINILVLILSVSSIPGYSQDSVKKSTSVKKTTVKPVAANPAINPATRKPWHYYTKPKSPAIASPAQPTDIPKAPPAAAAIKDTTTSPAPALQADKSLNGQYRYLLTKVYNYQQPFVAAIWKNFTDTLNSNRKQLRAANEKIAVQGKTISDLQADLSSKQQTLSESNSNADSINFIGIPFTKNTYSLTMWGLVIVLGAIAAFVIARSGSSRAEAQYRTKLYNELEEEFKAYKTKANEKEKKLARELQTERNKVDELMGR